MFKFNLYNDSQFKRILEEVYHIKEIAIFDDDNLNSLCPFFRSNKIIKNKHIFNMPFNFYYSPELGEFEDDFFYKMFLYSRERNENIVLKSIKKYKISNYVSYEKNSILKLDYKSYDDYFKSLRKNFRQNIRTACNKLDKKFKMKEIESIEELREFYKCLSKLYINKHKMVFQPFRLFRGLFEKQLAKFLIFINDDTQRILAGIVLIEDGSILHYNWGVTDPIFYKYSLNILLINELIKLCIERGIKVIDFGASPNSDNNLLFFKERWGCVHYPVYYYYTLNKPAKIDLKNSYLWARNLYSKLPKPFIRYMMPKIIPWLVF